MSYLITFTAQIGPNSRLIFEKKVEGCINPNHATVVAMKTLVKRVGFEGPSGHRIDWDFDAIHEVL